LNKGGGKGGRGVRGASRSVEETKKKKGLHLMPGQKKRNTEKRKKGIQQPGTSDRMEGKRRPGRKKKQGALLNYEKKNRVESLP